MSWRVVAAVAISTVLGTVACAAALVAGATTPPAVRSAAHADVPPSEPGPLEPQPSLVLGTLGTEPAHAQAEHAAGVRMAQLELGWDAYEPRDGVFDERYADRQRARLRTLREAGMQVVLGIGLQYPPDWVLAAADAQYVNQYGEAAAVPNLTFNQALRDKAEQYIARVDRDLGLRNFAAIRVGSGGLIEALYPTGHFSERPNSFWAYDANAQAGSRRPPTIPAPPYVGWRPGERAYQGRPFTAAQVEEWYAWYLAALADGVRWQIGTYRGLGFDGRYFVLMPGVGVRPAAYQSAIDRYLASDDPDGILGRGAVWHKLVEALRDQPGVVVYVSSVADGSGADDLCRPEDARRCCAAGTHVWLPGAFLGPRPGPLRSRERRWPARPRGRSRRP